MASSRILSGFGEVAAHYRTAIIDLWGVVHDGTRPYPGVLDCLARMRGAGIDRIFLSNAPRRADAVRRQIAGIGVPPEAYDAVVSSGEIAYRALEAGIDGLARDAPYYYLGPTKDEQLLAGLGYARSSSPANAAFLLVTGLRHDERETVADYEDELAAARQAGLPLLCANPDLRVMRGDRILLCAGALAARYEELGGTVVQFGKPYRTAYEACLGDHGVERRHVVAIGDSPRTDLLGAMNFGIDAIFVAGGLHRADVGDPIEPARLSRFLADSNVDPFAVLRGLTW